MWTPASTTQAADHNGDAAAHPDGADRTGRTWVEEAHRPLFRPREGWMSPGQIWLLFGFAMMFVHPVSRNWLIFPIYIISAMVGLARHVMRRHQPIAPLSLLFVIATGCILTLLALLRGTPGGVQVALPIVFGPAVYYAISLGMDRRITNRLPTVIAASTALVSITIIVVGLAGPQSWMFWTDPFVGSSESGGSFHVRMGAIGSLAGLIPFMGFYLASWHGERGRRYTMYLVVYGLAIGAAVVSGRTAILLVAVSTLITAPLAGVAWFRRSSDAEAIRRRRRRSVLPAAYMPIVLVVLGITLFVSFTDVSVTDTIERTLAKFGVADHTVEQEAFVESSLGSADIRNRQGDLLLDGFFGSPLLGDGTGSIAADIVRDERRPWAYELQFHLLLFRSGLFGAGLYLTAIAIGIGEIRKRWKHVDDHTRHVTIGAMGAALGMLMANATNPYLQAVGQQWALFLPVMVICARGHRRSTPTATAHGPAVPASTT